MLEDPQFRITLQDTVTAEFLKEVQDTKVLEFIKEGAGYFTLDFSNAKFINQSAVRNIEEIAYDVGENGILQCIGVGENVWYPLINTNIGGERLISLAEIYTKRSFEQLLDFFARIYEHSTTLGLTGSDINTIKKTYQREFEGLHGNRQEYRGTDDYDRMLAEFQVITAQRWVEDAKRKTDISAHLCYNYGRTEYIVPIDQIPDLLADPVGEEVPLYEKYPEGSLCQGVCKDWSNKYGWITIEDGVDVFVHFSDIAVSGFKMLHKGKDYEFIMHYSNQGPKGLDVIPL